MTEPSRLEELSSLSSRELHDRAISYAVRHGDIGFLWELLRAIPAAQAARGHADEAAGDLSRVSALLSDAIGSGEGELGEALRPVYLDYLSKRPDA